MVYGRGTVDPHDLPEQSSTRTVLTEIRTCQGRLEAVFAPFPGRGERFHRRGPRARARDPDLLAPVRRLAFPQGIADSERPPREVGWRAHPNPPRCHAKHRKKGGSLRPRPQFPARRSRPGGCGATENRTATCEVEDVHVRVAFPRTCTPVSHVRLWIGIGAHRRLGSRYPEPTDDPSGRATAGGDAPTGVSFIHRYSCPHPRMTAR